MMVNLQNHKSDDMYDLMQCDDEMRKGWIEVTLGWIYSAVSRLVKQQPPPSHEYNVARGRSGSLISEIINEMSFESDNVLL
ncbi:hypothetical protein CANARDRAFT_28654 [[Candida] arabinofermentans NRRL YB-2248]|uniref:Uncharacterized protein n=1 Tax=[Candida] arabinofermentans NRRL YB-2248 TaxID=983967 RepID=A0A1E4SZH6_9ASCO|nr:hypothetical protein CANARDRAFT_28654 [[Candida] arabinofermentans NRRL YB-2248]